jgi:hypothetical protein
MKKFLKTPQGKRAVWSQSVREGIIVGKRTGVWSLWTGFNCVKCLYPEYGDSRFSGRLLRGRYVECLDRTSQSMSSALASPADSPGPQTGHLDWGVLWFSLASHRLRIRPLPFPYTPFLINYLLFILSADHSGFLPPLEHWNDEFESHSRHGCLCMSILCVGSCLAKGWSPGQGVLLTVNGLRNWKRGQHP